MQTDMAEFEKFAAHDIFHLVSLVIVDYELL